MPELLSQQGVYTHLATDHQHYFEDGGASYHTRYDSWQFERGQEGDAWMGQVADPAVPESIGGRAPFAHPHRRYGNIHRQDWVNRPFLDAEDKQPQAKTIANGLDFMRRNRDADNWFLQIEAFDPHEPFFTQQHYKDLYPHDYDGPHFDWPPYRNVQETPEQITHVRYEYAALVSMCDAYLGKVLDAMDDLSLWDDTLLIVCTDHGYLLGEHDWWAKIVPPFYQEVAHTPLFIWDPRSRRQGERNPALVQMIDFAPTLLEYFGVEIPSDVQGVCLRETLANDAPTRDACLFGVHGGHVNITDGRYVYMRGPVEGNQPLYEYTLMPTHMRQRFETDELQETTLVEPFTFTKGCCTLRIPSRQPPWKLPRQTMLFNLESDYAQEHPLQDQAVESRLIAHMVELMRANDAPSEQFQRLGLAVDILQHR